MIVGTRAALTKLLRGQKQLRKALNKMSQTTDRELADIEIVKTTIKNNTQALDDAKAAFAAQAAVLTAVQSDDEAQKAQVTDLQAKLDAAKAAADASAAQVVADNAPVLAALDALSGSSSVVPTPAPDPSAPTATPAPAPDPAAPVV